MKKGYRYNSTIQFAHYQQEVANFGIGQQAMQLGQQAVGLAKQVPGAIGNSIMGGLQGVGGAMGRNVYKAGAKARNLGTGMIDDAATNPNALKMAGGQAINAVGQGLKGAGNMVRKNKALVGAGALGAGGLAAGAGANAMLNQNQQPGMY